MDLVKSARIYDYGGPESVKIEEVLLAAPRSGEVVIRTHAAGVNPIDWKMRSGLLRQLMPLPLPFTLGGEFSGVVEALGPGVPNFKVGDEVYGHAPVYAGGSGSFAEAVTARTPGTIASKPRSASHAEAAALPLAGVCAIEALGGGLRVSPGQSILIHGGAGGIGSMAIQLAKHLGMQVATTVSPCNVQYARDLGADLVIDYWKQNFETLVRGLDAVLDTVGGNTYVRSFRVLKRGGRIVSMLERPRPDLMKEFEVEAIGESGIVTTDRLTKLAALIDQRILKVHIHDTFQLEHASAALQHQRHGSPRGKVVLSIV